MKTSRKELENILANLEERTTKDYLDWVYDNWTARGEPLEFVKHKYLEQIYKDQSREIVYCKSAQCGATERMITEALWLPDQFKENALYLFPNTGDVSDLVQERIDEPINASSYLSVVSGRAKRIAGKQADKVGLKRMSKGFIYFRGSNKATQIISVSADALFIDELDRMNQDNVPFFNKRLKHSKRKWLRWASTPTIPGIGIDEKFQESDQHHCHVKCNDCDTWQVLDFENNIDQEKLQLVCKECRKEIVPWEMDMKWIPKNPESEIRGYHITQLYSPMLDVKELVKESLKTDEFNKMQFYNQSLGLAYEPKGAKITDADIQACIRDYLIPFKEQKEPVFMGVDVGRVLHYVIRTKKRVIEIGEVADFEDLDKKMKEYNIRKVVFDALPETRKVQEFINRFKGRAYRIYYTGLKEPKKDEFFRRDGDKVNTDRTLSLDYSGNEIKEQEIEMPRNINDKTDYKTQLGNLIRVIQEDKHGNKSATYVKTGPDHYRHAQNYAFIAKGIFEETTTPEAFVL